MGAARQRRLRAEELTVQAERTLANGERPEAVRIIRRAFAVWPRLRVTVELASVWDDQLAQERAASNAITYARPQRRLGAAAQLVALALRVEAAR